MCQQVLQNGKATELGMVCVMCLLNLCLLQNSYGTGLTDWDNCSMYGKLVLFIFAAWAGSTVSVDSLSCRQTACCSMLTLIQARHTFLSAHSEALLGKLYTSL